MVVLSALQPNTDIYLQNQGLAKVPLQIHGHFHKTKKEYSIPDK